MSYWLRGTIMHVPGSPERFRHGSVDNGLQSECEQLLAGWQPANWHAPPGLQM